MSQARPPYVRFEYRPKKNEARSLDCGSPQYDNIAYVIVMQYGAKDEFVNEAEVWLKQKKREAASEAYPADWVVKFDAEFKLWKEGQEAPAEGTPLQVWPNTSPAEIMTLNALGIRTVEDTANLTEQGIQSLGIGGRLIRDKARAFLDASKNIGTVIAKLERFEADSIAKEEENARLREKLADMQVQISAMSPDAKRGPGRPPREQVAA